MIHMPGVCCGCRFCHVPAPCQVLYYQVLYTNISSEHPLCQPSELSGIIPFCR